MEKVTQENISDLIEQWHENETKKELHEFLGLTLNEYAIWVKTDKLPNKK